LTVPQLGQMLAGLIEDYLQVNSPSALCRRSTRWLRRNEQARLYHHRSRKVMPRLKNQLRT
jgi:hypothetical protein